jgi:hypothetical protein
MNKKLTLLILLFPSIVFCQTQFQNGTLSIDFGKKDKKEEQQPAPDTTVKEKFVYPSDEEEAEERETPRQRREKNKKTAKPEEKFDFKKDGLFKGLFNVGINACQIDGDNQAGYRYLGFHGGVGVMVRYHKYLSTSLEINYSMKGAKERIVPNPNPLSAQLYRAQLDYIDIPISLLNIHDNKLVMFSLGLTPSLLVRYKERDPAGFDVTDHPNFGQPRRFDLSGFAGFGFLIKQQFYIGGKFSYSFLKMRGAYSGTKTNGQYNNVLTFRFMYILNGIKKKK